jgi:hypothetical protein
MKIIWNRYGNNVSTISQCLKMVSICLPNLRFVLSAREADLGLKRGVGRAPDRPQNLKNKWKYYEYDNALSPMKSKDEIE